MNNKKHFITFAEIEIREGNSYNTKCVFTKLGDVDPDDIDAVEAAAIKKLTKLGYDAECFEGVVDCGELEDEEARQAYWSYQYTL